MSATNGRTDAARKPIRAILDTDIGDDIDDAFALSLALNCPELEIVGVCTAWGPVQKRSKMVLKLLHIGGRDDIPVALGVPGRDSTPNQLPFAADYDETAPIAQPAVDFVAQRLLESPGGLVLMPYGPLTNIGVLLTRRPEVKGKIREIRLMGGMAGVGAFADREPYPEYNVKCDAKASQAVFASGVPITMVGLDVTMQCRLEADRQARLGASASPLAQAVMKMLELWPHDVPVLHDPLAVATAVDPSFVKTERMRIEVDDEGRTLRREGPPNAEVCVTVDAERFLDFFVERVSRPRA